MTERLKWEWRSIDGLFATWSPSTSCWLQVRDDVGGWTAEAFRTKEFHISLMTPIPMQASISNIVTERTAKILARKLAELIKEKKR